jgi:hypothetical protein
MTKRICVRKGPGGGKGGWRFMRVKRKKSGSCEQCNNYIYEDDYECYVCQVDLDEDEMARFLADEFRDCPYYQPGDEYLIVRKQI